MAGSNFFLGLLFLWALPGDSVFYGTTIALILVLVIKEMPIGTHMMGAFSGLVSNDLEEASLVSAAS